MLSFTVIVCEAEAVLPHESVAVQVRTILNLFTQVLSCVTWLKLNRTSPQLSDAVTLAGEGTPDAQATVVLSGTPDNVGAVLSCMSMIVEQVSCNKPLADVRATNRVSAPQCGPDFMLTELPLAAP